MKSYQRYLASPSAKQRLIGESWKCFKEALDEIAPGTRIQYIRHFLLFLERLDWDTEQLFDYYLKLSRDPDPRKVKQMRRMVSEYQDYYLSKHGVGESVADAICKAISCFFQSNELPFKWFRHGEAPDNEIPNISKEQINKLMEATGSPKVQSYITFTKDTGLRQSDLVALPIRMIREVLNDPSMEYYTFEWKIKKTGLMANPCIGPEPIKYLRVWMRYRVDVLGISAEDDDPIWCAQMNLKPSIGAGKEKRRTIKGGYLESSCIGGTIRRLVAKAGLSPLPQETRVPCHTSLRKFNQTMLESVKVPDNWINKFTGRKGQGTSGIYSKPPPDELIAVYKSAYSALSLIDTVEVDELERLRQENAEQKRDIAEYKEQVAKIDKQGEEYQSLFADVERLKKAQGLE